VKITGVVISVLPDDSDNAAMKLAASCRVVNNGGVGYVVWVEKKFAPGRYWRKDLKILMAKASEALMERVRQVPDLHP
jgi:hypothetical protein